MQCIGLRHTCIKQSAASPVTLDDHAPRPPFWIALTASRSLSNSRPIFVPRPQATF